MENPFKNFNFALEGAVIPSPKVKNQQLASATIEILGLNTERVLSMRASFRDEFSSYSEKLIGNLLNAGDAEAANREVGEFFGRQTSFLEYRIFLLANMLMENPKNIDQKSISSILITLHNYFLDSQPDQPFLERFDPDFLQQTLTSEFKKNIQEASGKLRAGLRKLISGDEGEDAAEPAEDEPGEIPPIEDTSILSNMYLEKVEIVNFKGIENIKIDFGRPEGKKTPALMILGENASGKSSILQAIALCLESPEKLQDLERYPYLKVKKILKRKSPEGFVRIKFLDRKDVLEVHFDNKSGSYRHEGPYEKYKYYLRGYGAHRILPRHDEDLVLPKTNPLVDINNLWDPYECLVDAEEWITDLHKEKERQKEIDNKKSDDETRPKYGFDLFILALKDLLNLESDGFVDMGEEGLQFKVNDEDNNLDELSAGFQSIIGTAADIVFHSPFKGADPSKISGIVLIDEIGAHLHPSWRMRIVNAYRDSFPNVQFIATTHEPLCLRGMKQGELVVMRKASNRVERAENIPNVENMRIDQILTSPVFGMNTTIDPDVEQQFKNYYDLLAKTRLTKKEKTKKEELRKQLFRFGVLGTDRRSRAIYDLIDTEIAMQKQKGEDVQLSRKTKNRVLDIWNNSELS